MTLKPRQNRCSLETFTRNRFRQKIQVVMLQNFKETGYRKKDHFTDDCLEVDHRYSLLGGTTHKRKKKTDRCCSSTHSYQENYIVAFCSSKAKVKRDDVSKRSLKNKERREHLTY
ncbi:uncharacterized protein [Montipora capricornis]|uniref:uncharacterized protein isoform X2 n=1 Tax=Montipora capricornis TaxID=246305 RepID=UPI0035F1A9C5